MRDELDHTVSTPDRQQLDAIRGGTTAEAGRAPDSGEDPAFFLSVLTRLGQDHFGSHDDLVLCLESQTRRSFEWVILVRPGAIEEADRLRSVLDSSPFLGGRCHFLYPGTDDRSDLLNAGLAEARGQYLVVLDDDDLVTHDWVEQFERHADGVSILRARAVTMPTRPRHRPQPHMSSEGVLASPYPPRFSLVRHLISNSSPSHSLAFPVRPLRRNGIAWLSGLAATEDWDFLMHSASVMAVVDVMAATAIYRISPRGHSRSMIAEGRQSWEAAEAIVRARIAERPYTMDGKALLEALARLESTRPGVRTSYTTLRVRIAHRTTGTALYWPLRQAHLLVKRVFVRLGRDPGGPNER